MIYTDKIRSDSAFPTTEATYSAVTFLANYYTS